MERLQRILSAHGVASRRASEDLIRNGRVSVNGRVVRELGAKADPAKDQIRVDGRALEPQRFRYLMLNKPSGYITSTSDERGRRTVMQLVDVPERVYPVGRLDRDTEGLLLIANDGDLANRVMHPRYRLAKEYVVLTDVRPPERVLAEIREGVPIDGMRVVPEEFRILRESRRGIELRLVIHEGLNRIVRRIMERFEIPVVRLQRTRIGPIRVAGLPIGGWRDLRPGEVANLYEAVGLDRPDVFDGARSPRAV
jgi:23S rRNA pseudouridine2605 synthase